MSKFKITETPHVIDDHLLNIIGNEFKFDHAKGLAEWLKNSADAYNRAGATDDFCFIRMKTYWSSSLTSSRL